MKFISSAVRKLEPYVYGEQPKLEKGLIKLNTNENPYPPHPAVTRLLREFNPDRLRFYPDPVFTELAASVGAVTGLPAENLVFGNGSDELLSLVFRIFFNPGERALFTEFTYTAYKSYADALEIGYDTLPMGEDFVIDLELLSRYQNKVFFLTNPNAPTGIALEPSYVEPFLGRYPEMLFIIDEAYGDFHGESCLPLVRHYPNILVLRTLSKAFSLCGARLGFAAGPAELITPFYKIKDPYNINTLTQLLGVATFEHYDYYRSNIKTIVETREHFSSKLAGLGFTTFPSQANYIFTGPPDGKARELFEYLKRHSIFVRYFNTEKLSRYLRISIGLPADMEKVYEVIKNYYAV